jgi:hypothetical protein
MAAMKPRGRSRTVRRALGAAVALPLVLGGCGSASVSSPPSGVDDLVIPTPSPQRDDFLNGMNNRWFYPGGMGLRWTYDVTDPRGTHRMRVEACGGGDDVDGVPTVGFCTQEAGRRTIDYYAEDDDGNTWWFGREGVWEAGSEGQDPGLAMAKTPRVGDGYFLGNGDRATVEAVDEKVTVPFGAFDDVVRIEVRSATGTVSTRSYAPGIGLVLETEGARVVRLVDFGDTAGVP